MSSAGIIASCLRGSVGPTDPFFAYVISLLMMEGANGSTTFTDHIFSPAWQNSTPDPPTVDTSKTVLGLSSMHCDIGEYVGTNQPGDIAPDPDLGMGTQDFTIEAYFWPDGTTTPYTSGCFYAHGFNATNGQTLFISQAGIAWRTGGTDLVYTGTVAAGSWVVFERYLGERYISLNGVVVAHDTVTFNDNFNTGTNLGSAFDSSNPFKYLGNIAMWRMTRGVARYSGTNQSMPTEPWPTS